MSGRQSATQVCETYKGLLYQLERDAVRAVRRSLALTADLAQHLPPEPWLSEQIEGDRPFVVTALWASNDELTYALAKVIALAREARTITAETPRGVPADRDAIWRELRAETPRRKKAKRRGGASGKKPAARKRPRPTPRPKAPRKRPRGSRLPLAALPAIALSGLATPATA